MSGFPADCDPGAGPSTGRPSFAHAPKPRRPKGRVARPLLGRDSWWPGAGRGGTFSLKFAMSNGSGACWPCLRKLLGGPAARSSSSRSWRGRPWPVGSPRGQGRGRGPAGPCAHTERNAAHACARVPSWRSPGPMGAAPELRKVLARALTRGITSDLEAARGVCTLGSPTTTTTGLAVVHSRAWRWSSLFRTSCLAPAQYL